MNAPSLQEQIEAARAYDSLFVPALFSQWATIVAETANIQSGQRVLDIACGTGVLSREVASRAIPSGYVAGLDPNPGMLTVANELASEIDWKHGVAESLPFPNESFDTVVCQFGLMFFSDRYQAIREMLRVLIPGGHIVVAVWDSLTNIPAYAAIVALLERLAGRQAADALSAPFVLGDRQTVTALFTGAGASLNEIKTYRGMAQFPSISVMVEADLRGWLPIMGVILTEQKIDHILHESEDILSSYETSDGRMVFDSTAHIITAIKAIPEK
ncbi:methyltransferase domain-containing protein [Chloroflexi bacterium TSY]|nr:methyltransferase domain-containing protein [Chloroflexi bacterium TSY]